MKTSILSVMAFAMMLSLQSACGEGTGGSGPETSSSLPKVEGFQLEGERWTCTADGKPLGGILFKPADLPRPPLVLAGAWARFPIYFPRKAVRREVEALIVDDRIAAWWRIGDAF